MRALALVVAGSLSVTAQAPVAVPAGASTDDVVALAAQVRPSPRQLAWQAGGFHAFVHFGMNTFTDREWGDGTESPETFAPTDFDADQWAETFAAAGMKGVVLTCKHHDGFCLWPSDTTTHDVASSPFRGGDGDVVGEVAAACRRRGLKFGVYLSPWDRSQQAFGTKAYEAVFLRQLRELCTGYGELFEVWFDGAHGPPDDPDVFDWQAVFSLVRELQPDAVIAITGPDVRWVGNEGGHTRPSEWSVLPLAQPAPGPFASDRQSWRALWQLRAKNQQLDLGGRRRLAAAKALCWWPAETDVSIRPGWFWHEVEDARVKPLATLLEYWFTAVGGNAVLLLNVPADRRGRIADPDVAVLRDVGSYLAATFDDDLAALGARELDGDHGEVRFGAPVTVDVFELREHVAAHGQRVEAFTVQVRDADGWRDCAHGTTIGFRRLVRTRPVTGTAFRFRVQAARGAAHVTTFALFRRPALLEPPTITRAPSGYVTLAANGLEIRYTLDGAPVTVASPRYEGPFAMPDGGTVRARAFAPEHGAAVGTRATASASFGLAADGWSIHDRSSEQAPGEAAANAIDGDPATIWHTRYGDDTPGPPHHLTIDLGAARRLTGFVYVPRPGGGNGTIADYELHGSADGEAFRLLAEGTFGNIEHNPTARTVRFAAPADGVRFVRLTARREVNGRPWASVAELSVLVR